MSTFDPNKFQHEKKTNSWWLHLDSSKIELHVPRDITGPDQTIFPFAEQTLSKLDQLGDHANSYLSQFIDKKYLHIHKNANVESLFCGFRSDHITVDLYFEEDVYGAWSVTFRLDRQQRWWPIAFCREEQ